MGNRRKARILAIQALFCMDLRRDFSLVHLKQLFGFLMPSKASATFFVQLVKGVMRARPELDATVERFSSHWKISRMPCADRNILRLAVFELLYCRNIPDKVAINEAIDLGKKFGTDESGAFINGILDSIRVARSQGLLQTPVLSAPAKPAVRRLSVETDERQPRAERNSADSAEPKPETCSPATLDGTLRQPAAPVAQPTGNAPNPAGTTRKPRRIVVRSGR